MAWEFARRYKHWFGAYSFGIIALGVMCNVLNTLGDITLKKGPVKDSRSSSPVEDAEEEDEEEVGLPAAVAEDGEGALDEPWDAKDEAGELSIGEVAVALCETDEGCVLDGGGVRLADCVVAHDSRGRMEAR